MWPGPLPCPCLSCFFCWCLELTDCPLPAPIQAPPPQPPGTGTPASASITICLAVGSAWRALGHISAEPAQKPADTSLPAAPGSWPDLLSPVPPPAPHSPSDGRSLGRPGAQATQTKNREQRGEDGKSEAGVPTFKPLLGQAVTVGNSFTSPSFRSSSVFF